MRTRPLTTMAGTPSLGVEVLDLDLAACGPDALRRLGELVASRYVVVVRGADVSKERFWQVCRAIGQLHGCPPDAAPDLEPDDGRDAVAEYFYTRDGDYHLPGLVRVTGMRDAAGERTGVFADGELDWHTNQSGDDLPFPSVALQGVSGTAGSFTDIWDGAAAFDALPEPWRDRLGTLEAIHRWTPHRVAPELSEEQDAQVQTNLVPVEGATLPLVAAAPGGRRGLHYSPHTLGGLVGLSDAEVAEVRRYLDTHAMTPEHTYRHAWHDGDVLFMDQIVALHRRPGRDTRTRLVHRIAHGFNEVLPDQPDYAAALGRGFRGGYDDGDRAHGGPDDDGHR